MINKEKFKNLILYLVSSDRVNDLGKTKLFKLIFFIDSTSYKSFGNVITGDKFLKFPRGPVPASASSILHEMEANSEIEIEEKLVDTYFMTRYKPLIKPQMGSFSDGEVEIIKDVVNKYGKMSRVNLVEISHRMESWINADDFSELDLSVDNKISPSAFVSEYRKDIEILSEG